MIDCIKHISQFQQKKTLVPAKQSQSKKHQRIVVLVVAKTCIAADGRNKISRRIQQKILPVVAKKGGGSKNYSTIAWFQHWSVWLKLFCRPVPAKRLTGCSTGGHRFHRLLQRHDQMRGRRRPWRSWLAAATSQQRLRSFSAPPPCSSASCSRMYCRGESRWGCSGCGVCGARRRRGMGIQEERGERPAGARRIL